MTDTALSPRAVAIITRTRERPRLLQRCIETVLAQTCTDYCHVIVNDGGPPEAVEAVLAPYRPRYGDRLQVLHLPVSAGMEAASNAGIRASASTYLVVLDDDDTWHPRFLEKALAAIAAPDWPNTRGVVCHSEIVYERLEGDTLIEEERVGFNGWMEHVDFFRLFAWNRFTGVGFLFERAALDEVGLFDEQLAVCGDWEFNLRFLSRFEIRTLPETLAFWHQRRDQPGAYGNSVLDGWPDHLRHRVKMSNQWVRDALSAGSLDRAQMFALANLTEYHEHIVAAHRAQEERQSRIEEHQRRIEEKIEALADQTGGALEAMREALARLETQASHTAQALEAQAARAQARKLKRRERRTLRYWRSKALGLFAPRPRERP